jgi:hypothetical protein
MASYAAHLRKLFRDSGIAPPASPRKAWSAEEKERVRRWLRFAWALWSLETRSPAVIFTPGFNYREDKPRYVVNVDGAKEAKR